MRYTRQQIAARIADDIEDGSYVNLGIGIPTLVANHLSADKEVVFHSENGMLGFGAQTEGGDANPDVINASKDPVAIDATAFRLIEKWRKEARLKPIAKLSEWLPDAEEMGLGNFSESRITLEQVSSK